MSNNTALKGQDKFRINTHYLTINKFCSEFEKIITAYNNIANKFLFFSNLHEPLNKETTQRYK